MEARCEARQWYSVSFAKEKAVAGELYLFQEMLTLIKGTVRFTDIVPSGALMVRSIHFRVTTVCVQLWTVFYPVATCYGRMLTCSQMSPLQTTFAKFYIHGSVHRESNLIIVQQDATYSVYYISVDSSTCFGCWHPSSGARTTVITASGIDELQWVKYTAINTNI